MKFQVVGQSRETGARMTLELSADSKAAAERKAMQQGMAVQRVVEISPETGQLLKDRVLYTSAGRRRKLLLFIAIVAGVCWYFRNWLFAHV